MIRIFTISFVFIFSGAVGAFSQGAWEEGSFQVIYSENTYFDNSGLAPYDFLDSTKSVNVQSGYLLLAHASGQFLEFSGDTLVDLETLHESLGSNRLTYPVDWILSSNKQERSQFQTYDPIMHNPEYIKMVLPRNNLNLVSEPICLWWKMNYGEEPDTFRIMITNLYYEPLDSVIQTSNMLMFDPYPYFKEEPMVVVQVFDAEDLYPSSRGQAFRHSENRIHYPDACQVNTSIKALELAVYLEFHHYYDEAGEYYKYAAENSIFTFYNQLFQNFKARQSAD